MGPRSLFTFVSLPEWDGHRMITLGLRAAFLLKERLATCHLKFTEFFSANLQSCLKGSTQGQPFVYVQG